MSKSSLARAVAFVMLGCLPVGGGIAQAPKEKQDKCCFAHQQYRGTCTEQPAANETCSSILDYLNRSGTTGKSYCNNSDLRGGWKQVSCEAGS
jgi:hypothetical protein